MAGRRLQGGGGSRAGRVPVSAAGRRNAPWGQVAAWLLALLVLPGRAAAGAPPPSPATLCEQAIATAERQLRLPAGLLAAVGRVETGRTDHAGVTRPWPYTVNAEGIGAFFPTREAAVAAVRTLQARGVRSIDVGCVQVNLLHHPAAFASLDEAFDPVANTAYGARFLHRLYEEMRNWPAAVAAYHSRTPELGDPYQARVLAVWTGAPLPPLGGPRSPYGRWPPPGVAYGALPPPGFAYRALAAPASLSVSGLVAPTRYRQANRHQHPRQPQRAAFSNQVAPGKRGPILGWNN